MRVSLEAGAIIGGIIGIASCLIVPPCGNQAKEYDFVAESVQENTEFSIKTEQSIEHGADPTPEPEVDPEDTLTTSQKLSIARKAAIENDKNEISQLEIQIAEYNEQIESYQQIPDNESNEEDRISNNSDAYSSTEDLGEFYITYYCNCSICCGQWAGGLTASGTEPTAGRTVAADLPFGTQLLINDHIYTVEDRGVSGNHIDIYVDSHDEANTLGDGYAEVYIVNE